MVIWMIIILLGIRYLSYRINVCALIQVFGTYLGEWPVDSTMWILMQWKRNYSKLRASGMFE
jgi:hypothetical protein